MGGNQSDHHKACSVYLLELNIPAIDHRFDRIKRKVIEPNRTALRALFECVMKCATQGLVFRGHRDEKRPQISGTLPSDLKVQRGFQNIFYCRFAAEIYGSINSERNYKNNERQNDEIHYYAHQA